MEELRAAVRAQVASYTPGQAKERRAALQIEEPAAVKRFQAATADASKAAGLRSVAARAGEAADQFRTQLGKVYEEPGQAFDTWRARVDHDRDGGAKAAEEMREHPETFGTLKTERVPSWRDTLGRPPKTSTAQAEEAARLAARDGTAYEKAREHSERAGRYDHGETVDARERHSTVQNELIHMREERKALDELHPPGGGGGGGGGGGVNMPPPPDPGTGRGLERGPSGRTPSPGGWER